MGWGNLGSEKMEETEERDWRGLKSSGLLDFPPQANAMMVESLIVPLTALQPPFMGVGEGGEVMVSTPGRSRKKDERIPQWGYHETKEFIGVRADLEKDFTQTKRNKTLWKIISGKMKEKGFQRSADQCKCKWKNLVNRYKGKETPEPENGRQCPFFEEIDAIFKERNIRAKNMDRFLLESETSGRSNKKLKNSKRILGIKFSDEDSDDQDEEEEESEDELAIAKKKRKADRETQKQSSEKYRANNMQELLGDFFQQQRRLEEEWRETIALREQERRQREHQWIESMEKLEHERNLREQRWRDAEDQRRAREEARSLKRDEVFAALMTKLAEEEN